MYKRQGTALVVDGQSYTPSQIVETTAQINEALKAGGEAATEAQIVNLLMISPFVLAEATRGPRAHGRRSFPLSLIHIWTGPGRRS